MRCGRYVARPQRRAASARPKSTRSASEGLALRGVGNGRAGPEVGSLACCLTGLSGCLQVLFPIRICDSLTVRFWPPIFQRPPWHFSALEVVFPSFSVFSCISIGVFRRPLSLQCPCTDAVFLGFSAKIDLRGPESSWRESKISGPALPLTDI